MHDPTETSVELSGDFHVHSNFSDDAVSTLAENIAAAESAGLRELRLVDHVRRSTTWVPEFVAAVAAEPHSSSLTVRTGVEAKLLDASGSVDVPPDLVIGDEGVDVIVIGDHQFPGVEGPWSPSETRLRLESWLTPADALDLYVNASVRAMIRHERVQLGHWFSILPKIGLSEDDLTAEHLHQWATVAAETGTLVEINEKWGCPGPRAVRVARDAGVTLVASTDSHEAGGVGRYQRVPAILRESWAA